MVCFIMTFGCAFAQQRSTVQHASRKEKAAEIEEYVQGLKYGDRFMGINSVTVVSDTPAITLYRVRFSLKVGSRTVEMQDIIQYTKGVGNMKKQWECGDYKIPD